MILALKIIIQLLLALGGLILMGFLGAMIYAFCFMVIGKGADDGNDDWINRGYITNSGLYLFNIYFEASSNVYERIYQGL